MRTPWRGVHQLLFVVPASITPLWVALPASGQAHPPSGTQVVTLTDTLPGGVGGVTVDASGLIYVADFGGTVWKVTPDGRVTEFVNSMYGSSGNAMDSKGVLFQSNFHGNFVSRVDRTGQAEEFAAGFNGPVGIAIDSGDTLFVTNCNGHTVSKVTPDGAVSEFAASDLFRCPNGVTRDPQGNLYVVNFQDGAMLKVTPDGAVSSFATIPGGGNGHVTFARGNLYATSFRGHQVWRVSLDGDVSLLAGTGTPGGQDGPALEATLAFPNGIAASPNGSRLYLNEFRQRALGTELVPPPSKSVLRQIRLTSITDAIVAALNTEGFEGIDPAYREFKQDPANAGINTEFEVNALGYRFLATGQIEAAIRVFELNTESYPQSWNVWDSLGEAHMKAGHTDQAIDFYEKSLELNPNNANGSEMLERLRSGS